MSEADNPQDQTTTPAQGDATTDLATAVEAFLADLLGRVDPTASVSVSQNERQLTVTLERAQGFTNFEGPGIQALEHLVDLHLRRSLREDAKVQVDVDDFRRRRTEELQALAVASAEQVKNEGKAIKLEPMTAWERKTVHEALENVDGVHTHSEGNLERFVVIAPQKKKQPAKSRGK